MTKSADIRERYINGELFSTGNVVLHKDNRTLHEVVDLGSNYLTLVDADGKVTKSWLQDVILADSLKEDFNDLRRKRSSSNQIAYAGYKTKNFTAEIYEQFKELVKDKKLPKLEMLSLIRSTDELLIESKTLSNDNYSKVKSLLERNTKYLTKFNAVANHTYRDEIVTEFTMFEMNEGLKVTALDKQRAAQIIADALDCQATGKPDEIVNAAAKKMKSGRYTPEAWKIAGKMFQMASDVGIKWDKTIFAPTTLKIMEIK